MMSLLPYYPARSHNPESMIRSFFDDPFISDFFRHTPDTFFGRAPALHRSVSGMMRVDVEDQGNSYLLTADMPGVQKENLKISGKDEKWLGKELKKQKATVKETWLLTVDKAGKVFFCRKEEK